VFLGITAGLLKKPKTAGMAATAGMGLCFLLTCVTLFLFTQNGHKMSAVESSLVWIPLENASIEFGILTNGLTLLMALIVTGVGALIFLYSNIYMEHDEGMGRFFAFLSLFAFSMLGIVFSNNLIQIFIFWELVGLSSYLLIGFWYEKKEASTAGKKAFITTRVGDVGMMIGILLLFGWLGTKGLATFNFLNLEHVLPKAAIPAGMMTAIALLIFMGVMGKSAQVPLHVWLPDAMEGPTPVSALIHAATMVAAGVFLLARINFIFAASTTALHIIAWTGIITAVLAGTIAVVQNDIKKVLAYSTLSQLGYMVLALGMSNVQAGMFHLTTHAFFKALLFLGAGSLIHAMHTQDIWEMAGRDLMKKMPATSWTFLIGTLALMGIPPLSGFYSKEQILEAAGHGPAVMLWLALAVVFLTSFYMGRLCTVVFFRKEPRHDDQHHPPHEAGWAMTAPLILLAVFSVIAGFLPIVQLLGASHHEAASAHSGHGLLFASLGLAAAGFCSSFFIYRIKPQVGTLTFPGTVLEKKYFFDDLYDGLIKYVQENIASASDWFERKVIVETGANGTAWLAQWSGRRLRRFQTGKIQHYALAFTAGVTVIVFVIILAGK
jgi:NADH-quinone oxidoreductase subunit L